MELLKHWKGSDFEFKQSSPLKKERQNCLSPSWKILIRKFLPIFVLSLPFLLGEYQ